MSMKLVLPKIAGACLLVALTNTFPAKSEDGATVGLPKGTSKCDIYAWPSFSATKAIPVYAEPNDKSKVLGQLPISDDVIYAGSEFHVIEAANGWLKIENAKDPQVTGEDGKPLRPRKIYKGTGWIHSDAAQIKIQSSRGYAEPRTDSPLVMNAKGQWLTHVADITNIGGCAGEWTLVDYRMHRKTTNGDGTLRPETAKPQEGRAWFRGACSNQFDACDMRSVDSEPAPTDAKP